MDICDPGKPWFCSVIDLNEWCRTANVHLRICVWIGFYDWTHIRPAECYDYVSPKLSHMVNLLTPMHRSPS